MRPKARGQSTREGRSAFRARIRGLGSRAFRQTTTRVVTQCSLPFSSGAILPAQQAGFSTQHGPVRSQVHPAAGQCRRSGRCGRCRAARRWRWAGLRRGLHRGGAASRLSDSQDGKSRQPRGAETGPLSQGVAKAEWKVAEKRRTFVEYACLRQPRLNMRLPAKGDLRCRGWSAFSGTMGWSPWPDGWCWAGGLAAAMVAGAGAGMWLAAGGRWRPRRRAPAAAAAQVTARVANRPVPSRRRARPRRWRGRAGSRWCRPGCRGRCSGRRRRAGRGR
jgi:hypothetical protein